MPDTDMQVSKNTSTTVSTSTKSSMSSSNPASSHSEHDDDADSSQDDQEQSPRASHSSSHSIINSLVVRRRHRIKGASLDTLESYYNSSPRPSTKDIALLARIIDEPEQRVRIWFNNRRGKTVRERAMRPPPVEQRILNTDQDDHMDPDRAEPSQTVMIEVPQRGKISLEEVHCDDPLVMAMKAKILDLQSRLEKNNQKLPPINTMFQSITQQAVVYPQSGAGLSSTAPLSPVDLTVFRRSLHELFTVISSTFRQKSKLTQSEIPLHLPSGGEQIERILQQCSSSNVRVLYNNSKRHYILTGAELMRLSHHAPMAEAVDCVVSLNDQQRVRVNGVCVVPLSAVKSGERPVLLRASCTRVT